MDKRRRQLREYYEARGLRWSDVIFMEEVKYAPKPHAIEIISDAVYHRNADGLLHRLHGPAIRCENGDASWWRDGLRHREDGPAVDFKEMKLWFLSGELMMEEEVAAFKEEFEAFKNLEFAKFTQMIEMGARRLMEEVEREDAYDRAMGVI